MLWMIRIIEIKIHPYYHHPAVVASVFIHVVCFSSLYFRSVGRRTERVRASSSRLPTKSWSPQIRPALSSTDSRTSSSRPPPSLSSGTVCFTPQWGGCCPTLHAELWLHPTLCWEFSAPRSQRIVVLVESLYVDLVSGANWFKIYKQTFDIIERKLHTHALEKWNAWNNVIRCKTVFSSSCWDLVVTSVSSQCVSSHVSGVATCDLTKVSCSISNTSLFFPTKKARTWCLKSAECTRRPK